jgi:putative transcriptional regulator
MAVIKNRIREIRKEFGLSQESLANMADTRRETINRIEKGNFDPTLYLAFKIAAALDRSIEEIFELDEPDILHE